MQTDYTGYLMSYMGSGGQHFLDLAISTRMHPNVLWVHIITLIPNIV